MKKFLASRGSTCTECGNRIEPGFPIVQNEDDEWVHDVCPTDGKVRGELCSRCGLIHPGEC